MLVRVRVPKVQHHFPIQLTLRGTSVHCWVKYVCREDVLSQRARNSLTIPSQMSSLHFHWVLFSSNNDLISSKLSWEGEREREREREYYPSVFMYVGVLVFYHRQDSWVPPVDLGWTLSSCAASQGWCYCKTAWLLYYKSDNNNIE